METVSSSMPTRTISFASIVTGALVGLLCYFAFNLLGTGLGLVSFEFDEGALSPGSTPLWVASLFMLVGAIVSFAIGGYVTGRLMMVRDRWNASLHGLSAFALAAVAMFLVVGASAVSGLGGLISTTSMTAGNAVIQRPDMMASQLNRITQDPATRAQIIDAAESARKGAAMASFSGLLLLIVGSFSSIWGARKGSQGLSMKNIFHKGSSSDMKEDLYTERADREPGTTDFPRAI